MNGIKDDFTDLGYIQLKLGKEAIELDEVFFHELNAAGKCSQQAHHLLFSFSFPLFGFSISTSINHPQLMTITCFSRITTSVHFSPRGLFFSAIFIEFLFNLGYNC
jgi:hypothetical protein